MKKAIIVGASAIDDLSFMNKSDFFYAACDGGYKYFLKAGVEPDLLVGDFDTLDIDQINNPKEIIRLNPVKDDTDTFFVLKELMRRGFDEFHLYGCSGKKLDHTIANIELLHFLSVHKKKVFLYTEDNKNVLFNLRNGEISFKDDASGTISIFSISQKSHGVTLKNLKYTLDDYTLDSYTPLGISNEFIGKKAFVKVEKGTLLIYTNVTNLTDE